MSYLLTPAQSADPGYFFIGVGFGFGAGIVFVAALVWLTTQATLWKARYNALKNEVPPNAIGEWLQ